MYFGKVEKEDKELLLDLAVLEECNEIMIKGSEGNSTETLIETCRSKDSNREEMRKLQKRIKFLEYQQAVNL